MKSGCVLLAVLLVVLVADVHCNTKVRKFKRPMKKVHTEDTELKDNIIPDSGDPRMVVDAEIEQSSPEESNEEPEVDPCMKVHCGAGRICELDENFEPRCVCIPTCPVETDTRRKVCSNHNETWTSDCAVYQHRCWCDMGDERCRGEEFKHVHIEYYGECRHMPDCTKEEMADFPRRMRDWLFNIMRDLADREELTPHFLKMEREAESNLTRRWTNAAVWKFCDLDGHPPDRRVSRHELFPIKAPLMSLEHCIAPFLNGCDKDNNHQITLKEWAECLELDEDELDHRCDELADDDDDDEED